MEQSFNESGQGQENKEVGEGLNIPLRPKRIPGVRNPSLGNPMGASLEGEEHEAGEPVHDATPVEPKLHKHSQAAQLHDIGEAISKPWVLEGAEANQVMWARVKGFPFWPAQCLPEKEVEKRLGSIRKGKEHYVAVMFFGTLEVAWVAPSDICSWRSGVEKSYHTKGHGRRTFQISVEQVYDFLTPMSKHRRRAPEGWWCKAPPAIAVPPELMSPETLKSKKRKTHSSKKKGKKPRLASTLPAPQTLVFEAEAPTLPPPKLPSPIAPPPAVPSVADASWQQEVAPELPPKAVHRPRPLGKSSKVKPAHDLLHKQAVESLPPPILPSPDVMAMLNKKPEYEHIRRNVWVVTERPRRMAKDDIAVCSCRPPRPPVSNLQPSASWPQALPGSCTTRSPSGGQGSPLLPNQTVCTVPGASPELSNRRFSTGNVGVPPGSPNNTIDPEDAPLAQLAAQSAPSGPDASEGSRPGLAVSQPTKQQRIGMRNGCGENCLNRLSYIHCDPRLCPCGDRCSNRPFHLLEGPRMKVFLTENRGWGVQASESIEKGSFIVEYAGEVIDIKECQARMRAANEAGEPHFYMMELGPGLVIDARKKGNLARLINSSCDPNCESQKWHDAATGEVRIGIFATRDIKPGEELTYDYQFQHSGVAAAALGYRCMCGAPTCRGTMDLHPERYYNSGRRIEVYWDGDGVYYRGTVTGYSVNTRKYTILYDDNDVERVCLESVPHRWLDHENGPQGHIVLANEQQIPAIQPHDDLSAALAARVSFAEARSKTRNRARAGPDRMLVKRANRVINNDLVGINGSEQQEKAPPQWARYLKRKPSRKSIKNNRKPSRPIVEANGALALELQQQFTGFQSTQLGEGGGTAEDVQDKPMDHDAQPPSSNVNLAADLDAVVETQILEGAPRSPAGIDIAGDHLMREASRSQAIKRQGPDPCKSLPGSPRQRRMPKRPRQAPPHFAELPQHSLQSLERVHISQHLPKPSQSHQAEGSMPRVDLFAGGQCEAGPADTPQIPYDSPNSGMKRRRRPISYAQLNGDDEPPAIVDPPRRAFPAALPPKKASSSRKEFVPDAVVSSSPATETALPAAPSSQAAVPLGVPLSAGPLPMQPPAGWENLWLRLGLSTTLDLFRRYSYMQAHQALLLHQLTLYGPQAAATPLFQHLMMQQVAISNVVHNLTTSFGQLPKQLQEATAAAVAVQLNRSGQGPATQGNSRAQVQEHPRSGHAGASSGSARSAQAPNNRDGDKGPSGISRALPLGLMEANDLSKEVPTLEAPTSAAEAAPAVTMNSQASAGRDIAMAALQARGSSSLPGRPLKVLDASEMPDRVPQSSQEAMWSMASSFGLGPLPDPQRAPVPGPRTSATPVAHSLQPELGPSASARTDFGLGGSEEYLRVLGSRLKSSLSSSVTSQPAPSQHAPGGLGQQLGSAISPTKRAQPASSSEFTQRQMASETRLATMARGHSSPLASDAVALDYSLGPSINPIHSALDLSRQPCVSAGGEALAFQPDGASLPPPGSVDLLSGLTPGKESEFRPRSANLPNSLLQQSTTPMRSDSAQPPTSAEGWGPALSSSILQLLGSQASNLAPGVQSPSVQRFEGQSLASSPQLASQLNLMRSLSQSEQVGSPGPDGPAFQMASPSLEPGFPSHRVSMPVELGGDARSAARGILTGAPTQFTRQRLSPDSCIPLPASTPGLKGNSMLSHDPSLLPGQGLLWGAASQEQEPGLSLANYLSLVDQCRIPAQLNEAGGTRPEATRDSFMRPPKSPALRGSPSGSMGAGSLRRTPSAYPPGGSSPEANFPAAGSPNNRITSINLVPRSRQLVIVSRGNAVADSSSHRHDHAGSSVWLPGDGQSQMLHAEQGFARSGPGVAPWPSGCLASAIKGPAGMSSALQGLPFSNMQYPQDRSGARTQSLVNEEAAMAQLAGSMPSPKAAVSRSSPSGETLDAQQRSTPSGTLGSPFTSRPASRALANPDMLSLCSSFPSPNTSQACQDDSSVAVLAPSDCTATAACPSGPESPGLAPRARQDICHSQPSGHPSLPAVTELAASVALTLSVAQALDQDAELTNGMGEGQANPVTEGCRDIASQIGEESLPCDEGVVEAPGKTPAAEKGLFPGSSSPPRAKMQPVAVEQCGATPSGSRFSEAPAVSAESHLPPSCSCKDATWESAAAEQGRTLQPTISLGRAVVDSLALQQSCMPPLTMSAKPDGASAEVELKSLVEGLRDPAFPASPDGNVSASDRAPPAGPARSLSTVAPLIKMGIGSLDSPAADDSDGDGAVAMSAPLASGAAASNVLAQAMAIDAEVGNAAGASAMEGIAHYQQSVPCLVDSGAPAPSSAAQTSPSHLGIDFMPLPEVQGAMDALPAAFSGDLPAHRTQQCRPSCTSLIESCATVRPEGTAKAGAGFSPVLDPIPGSPLHQDYEGNASLQNSLEAVDLRPLGRPLGTADSLVSLEEGGPHGSPSFHVSVEGNNELQQCEPPTYLARESDDTCHVGRAVHTLMPEALADMEVYPGSTGGWPDTGVLLGDPEVIPSPHNANGPLMPTSSSADSSGTVTELSLPHAVQKGGLLAVSQGGIRSSLDREDLNVLVDPEARIVD
eukprot:jgi/Botrbrau1/8158/Bobra.357_2s0006.1